MAFLAAVLLLTAFVVVERRVRWPLVDLSLLKDPRFSVLIVAGTVANVAYGVTIFLSTLYLQQVRDLDPLLAGLAFLGPSIGAAIGGALSGRLSSHRSPSGVMAATTLLSAVSLAALAAVANWPGYLCALAASGFALGLAYAFTTVATQAVVRPERAGEAAGITLTALITVAGVGVAVSSTVLEVLRANGSSTGSAIDAILAALAGMLLVAGLLVAAVTRRRVAT